MRARGPYREPQRDGATSGAGSEEEAVYPYLTQALAAERVRDQQQQAALARLARKARRARRGRPDLTADDLAAHHPAAPALAAPDLAAPDLAPQEPVRVDHDSRELAGAR